MEKFCSHLHEGFHWGAHIYMNFVLAHEMHIFQSKNFVLKLVKHIPITTTCNSNVWMNVIFYHHRTCFLSYNANNGHIKTQCILMVYIKDCEYMWEELWTWLNCSLIWTHKHSFNHLVNGHVWLVFLLGEALNQALIKVWNWH